MSSNECIGRTSTYSCASIRIPFRVLDPLCSQGPSQLAALASTGRNDSPLGRIWLEIQCLGMPFLRHGCFVWLVVLAGCSFDGDTFASSVRDGAPAQVDADPSAPDADPSAPDAAPGAPDAAGACFGPIVDTPESEPRSSTDCDDGECSDQTITCTQDCEINCEGQNSCGNLNLVCASAECRLRCSGQNSCGNAILTGPASGLTILECTEVNSCQGLAFSCGTQAECRALCVGGNACNALNFNCPPQGSCKLDCDEANSCQNLIQTCSSGPCDVDCEIGACGNLTQNCGSGRCTSCNGLGGQLSGSNCGSSCFCDSSC
jgi:hypothetical protein